MSDPSGRLRPADHLMLPAVLAALAALDLSPEDAGAVRLAESYARLIDEPAEAKLRAWALRWIGPELLKVLESLGATPQARAALSRGEKPSAPAGEGRLARLRASHGA